MNIGFQNSAHVGEEVTLWNERGNGILRDGWGIRCRQGEGKIQRINRDQQDKCQQGVCKPTWAPVVRTAHSTLAGRSPSSALTGNLLNHRDGIHGCLPTDSFKATASLLTRDAVRNRRFLRDLGSVGPLAEAIVRVRRKLTRAMITMMKNKIHATAAARPKLRWEPQPSSYRYMVTVIHWRSAPPSPSWSYMRGSSKICKPPIVEVMMTKMRVGRSIGTVTEKNWRIRPAPSMTAASYRSRGMACMAANKISVL